MRARCSGGAADRRPADEAERSKLDEQREFHQSIDRFLDRRVVKDEDDGDEVEQFLIKYKYAAGRRLSLPPRRAAATPDLASDTAEASRFFT